ncbi:hypothetical protein BT96DRAFT_1001986 [Gymnopus androsaceus JB14]|uniref:Uncharacterized protein n=1 Tax=Gymnopus androsaceus JB14 TaxID=1447944 RepID=A0A6A4GY12_9AGAR|nr:hypothetical protein BT96DRAFT_1001986 [Gymnopus androsaceus JB14]
MKGLIGDDTPLLQSPEISGPVDHVLAFSTRLIYLLSSAALIPSFFFVPADGPVTPAAPEEDDDPTQMLLQILEEHLSLALLSRLKTDTSDLELRGSCGSAGLFELVWVGNRIMYEYNREPGEITRATTSPILNRLVLGRMARLREDECFKAISTETRTVLSYLCALQATAHHFCCNCLIESGRWRLSISGHRIIYNFALEIVQSGLSTDPNQLASTSVSSAEAAMLISSPQDTLHNGAEIAALGLDLDSLRAALQASEGKQNETDKKQEDLLLGWKYLKDEAEDESDEDDE